MVLRGRRDDESGSRESGQSQPAPNRRPVPGAGAWARRVLWNGSAAADFRLCNNTSSRVGIALGYKDAEGWTTEGWWNISSRDCETLIRGTLVARFYYIYALDYDRGGEWSGQAFMCSRDKEFTIRAPRLPRLRLRPHRILRSGYQRTACLDRAVHRGQRSARAAGAGIPVGRSGWPRYCRVCHPRLRRPPPSGSPEAMSRLRRIKILATLGPVSSDRPPSAACSRPAPTCSASI